MPKIAAKPDLSEPEFQRALKRSGFIEQSSAYGSRRFAINATEKTPFVGMIPGIYQGRWLGTFDRRLTLKHLQNTQALSAIRVGLDKIERDDPEIL